MLGFLIDKFIKSRDFENTKNRNSLISLSGYMGLGFNILLFVIKILIGLFINSISVISDAVNNLTDSLASVITIIGSYFAAKPADEDHPYGHGRSEYIASLLVGISIIIVGLTITKSSIENIVNPQEVSFSVPMLIILIISIGIKVYMYFYNTKIYKIIDSNLNKSQALDSRNDILMSSMVVISVIFNAYFNFNIEGTVGFVISIIIILSGIEIIKEMGDVLLGKEIDHELIEALRKILLEGKYVQGVHDIELHEYGKNQLFGTAHVEVPVNIDVYTMHEIVDALEKRAKNELQIDLSIHMDPSYCLDEDVYGPTPCKREKV